MTEPDLTRWSEAALSLLDSLWNQTTMAVIRKRMFDNFGFYPSAEEARSAANRFKDKPIPKAKAPPSMGASLSPPVIPTHLIEKPSRPTDNPVHRVKPGTHKANKFSMLGGRIR